MTEAFSFQQSIFGDRSFVKNKWSRNKRRINLIMRLSVVLMVMGCVFMFTGITFAQDDLTQQGGTVRGTIVDTTTAQSPIEGVEVIIKATGGEEYTATTDAIGDYERSGIPAGRYLVSIYKDGYGDRVGKPVTVVNGGDHYFPLKMTKKDNITTFLQSSIPMYWGLILYVIIVLLIFALIRRSHSQEDHRKAAL